MSLDSSEINDNNSIAYFQSVIVDTDDINREKNNIAVANGIISEHVDYKILKVNSYYRLAKDGEWLDIDPNNYNFFDNNDLFLDTNLEIRQNFKIELFDNRNPKNHHLLPALTVGANKTLTKIMVTIHKNPNIHFYNGMEEDIINQINQKKIKSHILVGIREGNMRSEIKKMIFSMRVSGALESDYKIMAMEGIEPIESANDELIFRYQQHEHDVDDKERIDYSKRDFLTPVSNGDVIIEYIKPQIGRNGRNCKGELIAVLEPKVTNDKQINYADSIERVEDEKSVKYISKKSGYVTDKGGSYGIEEDMALNEIDFKTTGSIEAGLDSNIKINLSESDAMKDAIGAGMSVESTEVIVQGNIGPQVNIRARLTKIGGQTHATSMIHSDSATISVHRGSLEAIEANIDRIEGGKVVADIVKIKSMIGGEVIARQIYIEELNSNASLISSELIEIQELKGSNNKILFDTGATKDFSDTVKMLRDGLKSGDKEIEKSMKLLENKKDVIDKNKNSVEAIRKRIDEMKITGEKVPSTFLIKLKDYQQLVNEYNQVLKQIKEVKEIMRLQRIELNEIQSKIYNAKVVNHSPWKEYNEIKFKLIEPPVVLEYSTKEMENAQSICLKHDDDNKLYISRNE